MSGDALIAHSVNRDGVRHSLVDHLRGSAVLARRFGEVFGAGELAEYLAVVHDVGKGCGAWQEGLLRCAEAAGAPVGVPHKGAGVQMAARFAGRPFAAVVQGHHGGLPDQQKVRDVLACLSGQGIEAGDAREAIEAVGVLVPEIFRERRIMPPGWLLDLGGGGQAGVGLGTDLLVRMVFSCLVDADFLDTAAHFDGTAPRVAGDVDMGVLAARYAMRRGEYLAGQKALRRGSRRASEVDVVRERVFEEAVAAAAGERGMYVLHVPTGGAKTMAAGGFALRHAAVHGLRRVVFAVPFISITEQNAQVYRDLLDPEGDEGEPVVLEHHSGVRLDQDEEAEGKGRRQAGGGAGRWDRLAAENWDAPVVVTTTVQLFQSLFGRRPSQMRKVHRLAGSVIVLDEVQALPDRLLVPILSVLRGLVEHFGATVVLASATQPEFWTLPQMEGLARRVMVGDVKGLFGALSRVRYEWRLGAEVTWESVADEIVAEGGDRVLTVVNTTRDSARLHRLLTERLSSSGRGEHREVPGEGAGVPVLHLSTRMTAEHRREAIGAIRRHLKNGTAVHVVSTSLIEAGVDVDFPRVYRAWAPAESLQQAAGRCNRDGHLQEGAVVVFRPADGGVPKDPIYRAALDATGEFFGPGVADPDDLGALSRYYAKRYASHGTDGRAMGQEIQRLRQALDFPAVADAFQMIDDRYAQPVVVIRPEASPRERELIEAGIAALRSCLPCGPEPLRRLQPHLATLPRHEVSAAVRVGLAEPVVGDLVLWLGHYDSVRGLDADDPEDRGGYVF
ncbi:CRISPR-associated endonuclease Cas3'' [Streptomyces sp. x-80]|uniref:CRISPR-associated endonuclease Cas3'' n=1 Tax=Streptomyces sp. x-80 TaxID=2789282 RepID=UPI00397FCB83